MQREASQHRRLGKARIKTGIAPDALGVALVELLARALSRAVNLTAKPIGKALRWLFRAVGKASAPPPSPYRAYW